MKKKIVVIIFSVIIILSYGVYWAFFDMGRLPKGKLIAEVQSPDGNYTLRAYVSGTSLSADAVRGELNYNKMKKKPRNIYWNYKESSADIKWKDNVTVVINGHELNVLHDTFDFRRNKLYKGSY